MADEGVSVRECTADDDAFVWECLGTLRGDARYSVADLGCFLRNKAGSLCSVLVAESAGARVGMVTCNRVPLPRYLGFGIELEEVVVHPRYQGKGLARPMLQACIARYLRDPDVRRITVHSDDRGRARHLYSSLFTATEVCRYQVRGTPA